MATASPVTEVADDRRDDQIDPVRGDPRGGPGTVRTLTFGGQPQVTLAAGGHALSDPVPLTVAPLTSRPWRTRSTSGG